MIDNYKLFQDLKSDEKEIFNLLQKNGAMSKNRILLETRMKLTTLNRIMNPLEKKGVIVEKCIGESTGGRRPVLYDINICRFYIICIDISETYIQISMVNLRMEIIYKKIFYIESGILPDEMVKKIQNEINHIYIELRLDFIELVGVGLTVDTMAWFDVPAKEMLEEKLECNIISENRANSVVVAEYLYGSGKMFNNLAYFDCGSRIREGTILGGKILRTAGNNEYIFEQVIYKNSNCVNFKNISEKTIVNAAEAFGSNVDLYANLLNLECIILDGYLAKLDLFYNTCIKYVNGKVAFKREGYFKSNAVSIGAAALVIERSLGNKL
ncbi:ROK family transcriptional regulator [Clostridium sp. LBM24168]